MNSHEDRDPNTWMYDNHDKSEKKKKKKNFFSSWEPKAKIDHIPLLSAIPLVQLLCMFLRKWGSYKETTLFFCKS